MVNSGKSLMALAAEYLLSFSGDGTIRRSAAIGLFPQYQICHPSGFNVCLWCSL